MLPQSHLRSALHAAMLLDVALTAAAVVVVAAPIEAVVASAADVEALQLDPALRRPQCLRLNLLHGTHPQLSLELGTRSLRPKAAPARGARSQKPPPRKLRRRRQCPEQHQRCFTTQSRPPNTL